MDFDSMAATYTNGWTKCAQKRVKIREFTSRFGLENGMVIVEPGCGNGEYTPFLLEIAGEQGEVICLDASKEMVKRAGKRFRGCGNVKVLLRCASRTGLKKGLADAVVCFNCFPHFDPKERFMREFGRLLKPGGLLVIAHDASAAAIDCMHRRKGFDMKKHSMPPEDTVKQLIEEAGFMIRSCRTRCWYLITAERIDDVAEDSGPAHQGREPVAVLPAHLM